MWRSTPLAVVVGVMVATSISTPAQTVPDFATMRDETVSIIQDLIRIDTSNPPGNETKVADYLKGILDREGIASEILSLEPGRGNLVARLKGTGSKPAILLMGHTDVVGVERDRWSFDPFAGTVTDGHVYGRGAVDDKDTVAAALVAFLTLHRQQVALDRDVIYLAEAGEEGSSQLGIGFMVDRHWDKIESEFALAEGGTTSMSDGAVRYVGVATTEKVPRRLTLVATGTSGHGSMPRLDNPVVHLAAAVAKVGAYQAPMRLNATTRAFFEKMAAIGSPDEAYMFTHLEDPVVGSMIENTLRHSNIRYASTLRTSISPTIISGGFRSNVIPAEAEATLDVRAVPDEDMDALVADLTRLIDDAAIEIRRAAVGRPAPAPSRLDSEVYAAIERAQRAIYPNAVTVPMMLTGATDMAQLRAKGVQAYGLGSPTLETEARAHGNDERVSVDSLGEFTELIYRVVVDVAASSPSR